jgi:hypothetical protein
MKSVNLLILNLIGLLCASCSTPQPPVVDMSGIKQETYNRDLAHCYNSMPFFAVGNAVTNCMQAKGYRILYAN